MSTAGIVTSVAVVSGSTIINIVGSPSDTDKTTKVLKVVAAGFLLGAALSLADSLNPKLGTSLGLLIAVGALSVNGPAVLKALQNATGTAPAKTPTRPSDPGYIGPD